MKLSVDTFALQHSYSYLVARPWTFWDRTDILGQDAHSATRWFRQRRARTQTKKLSGTGRTFWDRTDILGQDRHSGIRQLRQRKARGQANKLQRNPDHDQCKAIRQVAATAFTLHQIRPIDTVHGYMVYTERAETAAVSRGTSHATTKQC